MDSPPITSPRTGTAIILPAAMVPSGQYVPLLRVSHMRSGGVNGTYAPGLTPTCVGVAAATEMGVWTPSTAPVAPIATMSSNLRTIDRLAGVGCPSDCCVPVISPVVVSENLTPGLARVLGDCQIPRI